MSSKKGNGVLCIIVLTVFLYILISTIAPEQTSKFSFGGRKDPPKAPPPKGPPPKAPPPKGPPPKAPPPKGPPPPKATTSPPPPSGEVAIVDPVTGEPIDPPEGASPGAKPVAVSYSDGSVRYITKPSTPEPTKANKQWSTPAIVATTVGVVVGVPALGYGAYKFTKMRK